MSNFGFLESQWPQIHEAAVKAQNFVYPDARAAGFYARRALELALRWAYTYDSSLKLPYVNGVSALIHEPTFKVAVGQAVFEKARLVNTIGNQAVHSDRRFVQLDALNAVRELFQITYWLARTYSTGEKPDSGRAFDASLLPKRAAGSQQSAEQLRKLEADLRARDGELAAALADNEALDTQLKQLRQQFAAAKKANTAVADTHDYSEAQTRDAFIDVLLRESGWTLDGANDLEFEVEGMPNSEGKGFVDYVLWGDDGKPLGIVEAKRTKKSPQVGQQQARLYADCLEAMFGQRPVIFYTNGYEHWIWDDQMYPPREVSGFLTKQELELTIQRRATRQPLAGAAIDEAIAGRAYQQRAIRRIAESFEADKQRKTLLVMATGAGKTRTVIGLADLLMRCSWAKRVLFLADRVALVNQTVGAFKEQLPNSSPVNLVTERDGDGRVFVSTYPTMMGLIDETKDGERRLGPGYFDLIVIDEAHRSVYAKYGAIFDYFDSLLVGLTATPKDEIDFNTYGLFDLERGVPTDVYSLAEAVADKFLVPAKAVSVPLKYPREGIKYEDLSEEEKEAWDEHDWDETGAVPDRVEAEAVNKWLFNKDTVDKVLEHLMTHGQKVAGGDRLAKTIIFAKNQKHAEFIAERFDANYPHYKGEFARGIHHGISYAQDLIDDFSATEKMPQIAISVDMLDTGIDVPDVANLVFFKLVRSNTKFWQMIGRGTRLRPDLFGPGKDKEFFYVFDYCENLEFFNQQMPTAEGTLSPSLSKRLFTARAELAKELQTDEQAEAKPLREKLVDLLRSEVGSMNPSNFVVRPSRKAVEKYGQPAAWNDLSEADVVELTDEVAGLPTELKGDDEEAKRFDMLMVGLQLALVRAETGFDALRNRVVKIASLLEEQKNIPKIKQEMELILEIQTEDWWQDVTLGMLENARKRLRDLIRLIEKSERKIVYTDFEDELSASEEVELVAFKADDSFENFRLKTQAYLRDRDDDPVVVKLRMNEQLTPEDLEQLERILLESGVGSEQQLREAEEQSEQLGLFVRSLVGLDRKAAKRAFEGFLAGGTLTANQIHFVDLIINYLTDHGVMEPSLLYQPPFTDVAAQGPEGLFSSAELDGLIGILGSVREAALVG